MLGHNGAGKTTAIRCITGALSPTSGSVVVDGRNVFAGNGSNMDWLRANIGVCPQHDVLWDELTASEHVRKARRERGGGRCEEVQRER